VISAILVVTLRNVFHSALFLVLAFFMVAGIYLMLHAEFLAVVQVLIYVGAVTILILFAIMLTYQIQSKSIRQVNEQVIPAGIIAVLFLALAVFAANRSFGDKNAPAPNQGAWTASVEVSDLPASGSRWDWLVTLEDTTGRNYIAGGVFVIVPQSPRHLVGAGAAMETNALSGYILSPNSDFSSTGNGFGPNETINLKIWTDRVDYKRIIDATWKVTCATDTSASMTIPLTNSNPETIGRLLMSKFVLPFEVVSVLLLVALIGAIVISRKDA